MLVNFIMFTSISIAYGNAYNQNTKYFDVCNRLYLCAENLKIFHACGCQNLRKQILFGISGSLRALPLKIPQVASTLDPTTFEKKWTKLLIVIAIQ